jgi:hypothetical protein
MFLRGILTFWLVASLLLLSGLTASAPRITPPRVGLQHIGALDRAPRVLARETQTVAGAKRRANRQRALTRWGAPRSRSKIGMHGDQARDLWKKRRTSSRRRERLRPSAAVRRRRYPGDAAVESRLLSEASRTKLLARFVDRSTGLVKTNVSAHCALISRRYQRQRRFVSLCQVWQQPDLPSSGVKVRVLTPTKHKPFVVMAYRRSQR